MNSNIVTTKKQPSRNSPATNQYSNKSTRLFIRYDYRYMASSDDPRELTALLASKSIHHQANDIYGFSKLTFSPTASFLSVIQKTEI